uniref:Uncharacterized protein n=1 Tax=Arundo donax TaxID=35708 RepID=A0A0A9H2C5_ARUDO
MQKSLDDEEISKQQNFIAVKYLPCYHRLIFLAAKSYSLV